MIHLSDTHIIIHVGLFLCCTNFIYCLSWQVLKDGGRWSGARQGPAVDEEGPGGVAILSSNARRRGASGMEDLRPRADEEGALARSRPAGDEVGREEVGHVVAGEEVG